jgi:hypothetical protein
MEPEIIQAVREIFGLAEVEGNPDAVVQPSSGVDTRLMWKAASDRVDGKFVSEAASSSPHNDGRLH